MRTFLKGNQVEGQINTSFDDKHEAIFEILRTNESGEVTPDELGKFLMELLKNQVKELQVRVEVQKYQRAVGEEVKLDELPKEAMNKYGANLKK